MTATTISTERCGPLVHIGAGTVVPLTEAVRRLRRLPPMERNVLALRLGLIGRPRSLAQTAASLGLTQQAVRRIESQAGSRLRDPRTAGETS